MLKLKNNKNCNSSHYPIKSKKIYPFVLDFLNIPKNIKYISSHDLYLCIKSYLKTNNFYIIVNGFKQIKIINKLKILLDNCILIANKFRNKKIIIPKMIKHRDILHYLPLCFISNNDIFIQNLIKIFKNIFCEDIIIGISTYLLK